MTGVRVDVVALMLDVEGGMDPEKWLDRTMRHKDGRPFTDEDYELFGKGTRKEVEAVLRYLDTAVEFHKERQGDMGRMVALTEPYWSKHPNAPLRDVRAQMTAEDQAELDAIVDRLWPGEVIA